LLKISPIEHALDALLVKDALVAVISVVAILLLSWWGTRLMNSMTIEAATHKSQETTARQRSPIENQDGEGDVTLLHDHRPAA